LRLFFAPCSALKRPRQLLQLLNQALAGNCRFTIEGLVIAGFGFPAG